MCRLLGGVHLLLALPQGHRQHLAALAVGENQTSVETALHLERRQDVFYALALHLVQLLRTCFDLA
jgi:hypothetical protein